MLEPWQQLLEEDAHLQPCEMLAETDMSSVPEGAVEGRIPVDSELIRFVKHFLVAIA